MARTLSDIETLRTYFAGLMGRADHHAQGVREIALALAGAVIWRKDPDAPLEVKTYRGEMANALWLTVSGQRYALSFHHGDSTIDLRRGGLQGETLGRFDNATPLADVYRIFDTL